MATTTKERPILFSGPMIQALLDGRKTQTRRIVKPQPTRPYPDAAWCLVWKNDEHYFECTFPEWAVEECPYGRPGDRLWVREALHQEFTTVDADTPNGCLAIYSADGSVVDRDGRPACYEWQRERLPSIHMPRWASRITLEITDVRVERANQISPRDAYAEGARCSCMRPVPQCKGNIDAFRDIWESINGVGSWALDPWLWVLTFRRAES